MKSITVKELQENFDYYIDQVESGKYFLIKYEKGDVLLIPYTYYKEVDDLIRIHTDHNEGC